VYNFHLGHFVTPFSREFNLTMLTVAAPRWSAELSELTLANQLNNMLADYAKILYYYIYMLCDIYYLNVFKSIIHHILISATQTFESQNCIIYSNFCSLI